MRSAALLLLLVLPPLSAPGAAAGEPALHVTLPVLFDFVTPGTPATIDGTLSLAFAADASCPDALSYGLRVANRTAGLTVTVQTANGSIPGKDIRPDGTVERPVRLRLEVAPGNEAYSRLDTSLEVRTGACGTIAANRTVAQTGSRAGFLPKVDLKFLNETSLAWHVRATNLGNARVRLPWVTLQPDLGRVLVGGSVGLDGPGSATDNRSAVINVAKGTPDLAHDVRLDLQVAYDGNYPAHDYERPPVGAASLVLHHGATPTDGSQKVLQYGLVGLAVLLVAGGILAGNRLRRGKDR